MAATAFILISIGLHTCPLYWLQKDSLVIWEVQHVFTWRHAVLGVTLQFDAEVREWIVRPFTLWDIQTHSAQLLHTTYLLACVCACVCVCVCVCPASPVSSHGCFLSVPLWVCRTSQPPPVSGGRLQEKYKHTGDPFKTPSQTRVGFPDTRKCCFIWRALSGWIVSANGRLGNMFGFNQSQDCRDCVTAENDNI